MNHKDEREDDIHTLYATAQMMAIEALEKQIPKKPKKRVRGVYGDDSNDWLYDEEWDRCPTCRKDKEVYKGWDYCPLCGQAIDWSDDEET